MFIFRELTVEQHTDRVCYCQIERVIMCCFSAKDYDKYLEIAPRHFPPQNMYELYAEHTE